MEQFLSKLRIDKNKLIEFRIAPDSLQKINSL